MLKAISICCECSVDLRPHARYCDNCGRLQPRTAGSYSDASMSLAPITCRTLQRTIPVIAESVPALPELPHVCDTCSAPAQGKGLCSDCGNLVRSEKSSFTLTLRYVARAFSRIATVTGRAPRREYWSFALVTSSITAAALLGAFFVPPAAFGAYLAASCVMLAVFFVASVALNIRRLHDTGRSGLHVLWMFLPLAGSIILWILCSCGSGPNAAKYGPPEFLSQ